MRYLWLFAAILAWLFGSGCQLAPTAFPKELGDVARAAATSMTDQAVWETMVANVNGQVIDPGMEVSAGVLYVATARLKGVSGQVGISGSGSGSGEGNSPEASAAIRAVLADPGFWAKVSETIANRIAPPVDSGDGAVRPLTE